MKHLVSTLSLSIFLTLSAAAQERMTLDDCMRYAVEHSTTVGQRRNDLDSRRSEYAQAIASALPSVSASIGAGENFGRSIDPETNAYNDITTFSNSYSLGASMPLFAGLSTINTIRAANVARAMGAADLQVARDEAAIETMTAYMDVVYYTHAIGYAEQQLAVSRALLAQARKLFELGRRSAADVAEIESQEAGSDYLLTTQQNNLELARIRLRETMNYPQEQPLEIDTELRIEAAMPEASFGEVLDRALTDHPKVLSAAANTRYYRFNFAAVRGRYLPSLSLSGGINTNYNVNVDNRSASPSFSSQFRNKRGSYIQLSMSIPIFSGLNRRAATRRARNGWANAALQQTAVQRTVESEVAQTFRQMIGYGKQYVQGQKKVRAAQLAYDGIARKFEKGLVSAVDVQTASATLLQAQSDRLQSRLQYILKSRMVEYYNGTPLVATMGE